MNRQEKFLKKVVWKDGDNIKAVKGTIRDEGEFVVVDTIFGNEVWIAKRLVESIKGL